MDKLISFCITVGIISVVIWNFFIPTEYQDKIATKAKVVVDQFLEVDIEVTKTEETTPEPEPEPEEKVQPSFTQGYGTFSGDQF